MEEALERLRAEYLSRLKDFLDTGVFEKGNQEVVEAYTIVLRLTGQEKLRSQLYSFYTAEIRTYLQSLLPHFSTLQGEFLLSELTHRWTHHKIMLHWMYKIFSCLDDKYVRLMGLQPNIRPLIEQGLLLFRTVIIDSVRLPLSHALLSQFNMHRDGVIIDSGRLKQVLQILGQVGLKSAKIVKKGRDDQQLSLVGESDLFYYHSILEQALVEDSELYYDQKVSQWILYPDAMAYVGQAKAAMEREEELVRAFLDSELQEKVLRAVRRPLVQKHAAGLVEMTEGGCEELLRAERRTDLQAMFQLFKRVESTLCHITDKLEKYLVVKGTDIAINPKWQRDPSGFVNAVLAFLADVDSLLDQSFSNHSLFLSTREHAFQVFLNSSPQPLLLFAQAFDLALRQTLKGCSETQIDQHLDELMKLLEYIQDRDMFVRVYTKDLGRRLLEGTNMGEDVEKKVVRRLKVGWGVGGLGRLMAMLQDLEISRGISGEFSSELQSEEMSAQILRSGCWPEQLSIPCAFAPELDMLRTQFETYYRQKHQGRNLTWYLTLGVCDLTCLYLPKRYLLSLPPFLATILLLFNTSSSLTLTYISAATHIPVGTLRVHLKPLFTTKCRLLLCEKEELGEMDEIQLNEEFESNALRIKVPRVRVKQGEKEREEDRKAVMLERRNIVDSVIVRVAKSRKTLKYIDLVQEVLKQVTSFRPLPGLVKEQVESLMQREYLQRDEEDSSLLLYMP
jgi:hypothetical protein